MGGLELLTDERGFLQCRGRGRRGASYGAGAVVGGAMGPDNPSSSPPPSGFFLQGFEWCRRRLRCRGCGASCYNSGSIGLTHGSIGLTRCYQVAPLGLG